MAGGAPYTGYRVYATGPTLGSEGLSRGPAGAITLRHIRRYTRLQWNPASSRGFRLPRSGFCDTHRKAFRPLNSLKCSAPTTTIIIITHHPPLHHTEDRIGNAIRRSVTDIRVMEWKVEFAFFLGPLRMCAFGCTRSFSSPALHFITFFLCRWNHGPRTQPNLPTRPRCTCLSNPW